MTELQELADQALSAMKSGPAEASFALERLGEAASAEQAMDLLGWFLFDPSPLVREGAILGFATHMASDRVRELVERVLSCDPSPGVRDAAMDMLDQ